ncbi:MAG: UDP-galactopyranose mutase [Ferruginibacter sp.]
MGSRFLVIGAGFSGSVLANKLVNSLDCRIEIWDERSHVAGNCFTKRDEQTQVMVHQYGPHIFNTDKKEIWDFVNGFVKFFPYVHRVKARSGDAVYSLPVNLHTINQFFNKTFSSSEAIQFLDSLADKSITNPQNFEEQALRFIGRGLYDAFFYGYTKKQWGCEPTELPASILKRIPVRFTYDDRYHSNPFTGIPMEGYTALIEKLVVHPFISISLNRKFVSGMNVTEYDHVFFTGPLDAYFNYRYGRLGYRTVTFEKGYADGDYQGGAQVNYCDLNFPFTRITEHKHFAPWEEHSRTVYFKEFSKETREEDVPYYPKRLKIDMGLLKLYRAEAEKLHKISFLGRLATYRYMDMHQVIGEALDFAKNFVASYKVNHPPPVFSNIEPYE